MSFIHDDDDPKTVTFVLILIGVVTAAIYYFSL